MKGKKKEGVSSIGLWGKVKDFFYDVSCEFDSLKKDLRKNKPAKKLTQGSRNRQQLLFVWLGLAIPLLNLAVFWVYTNISSVFIAFEHKTADGITEYGVMNFITIFKEFTSSNSQIREGLINTLIFFAFNNFIILPLCYLSAYFIYKKILMHSVFKYVFFIPSIVSAVILTSFLKFMLSPNGPITILWGNIFGDAPIFLSDSRYAMPVLLFYNLWTGFGVQLIYFHASLVRIPKDVIEYATLDGVTPFQELIHILFPLTFPFYMTFVILGFGGIFSASGPVLLLTEGAYGTMDLAYWSFVTLTTDYVNGTSLVAALGQLETLIALPIALFAKKLSDRIETVEY